MKIPKFLMGDHTDHPNDIFIIHTDYPRFIINLIDDDIEFLEDLRGLEEDDLAGETAILIEEASAFYDEQVKEYDSE